MDAAHFLSAAMPSGPLVGPAYEAPGTCAPLKRKSKPTQTTTGLTALFPETIFANRAGSTTCELFQGLVCGPLAGQPKPAWMANRPKPSANGIRNSAPEIGWRCDSGFFILI